MAVKLTAEQFQEKHARRLKAAVEDMRAGVSRVTEAPGRKAAAKKQKWIARLSDPATQEKWARRVAAVTVDEWKDSMLNKGINRVAAGIDGAKSKVIAFAEAMIPHQNSGLTELSGMPDLTLEDSVNRASFWIRHMAKFKY